MSRQCPFPVQSTDSRHSYHTGNLPGFTLGLTLIAILAAYAGMSHAAPVAADQPMCLSVTLTSADTSS